jgi:hypothetical protein
MPEVTVVGQQPAGLVEEQLIGPNQQPRWTAERRFPSTRVYVQPPGTAQFEFWLRPTSPREGPTELRTLAELEFGLPYRFQLDLYAHTESVSDGPTQVGESVELHWALADWNKIWGNPVRVGPARLWERDCLRRIILLKPDAGASRAWLK